MGTINTLNRNTHTQHISSDNTQHDNLQDTVTTSNWKNLGGGHHFEQHKILLSPDDSLEDQLFIYSLRKNNNYNLVRVYEAVVTKQRVHSFGYAEIKVVTERISSRFDSLAPVPIIQGLSIMTDAAIGFQCLYKHVGYFQINDYLIGFNDNRQTRVWLNTNPASNSKMSNNFKQPFGDIQHLMVIKLIQVVEGHIEKSPSLALFVEKRGRIDSWNFKRLVEFIQDFILEMRWKAPKTFALNIDHKPRGQEKSSRSFLHFKVKSQSPCCDININKSLTNHPTRRNIQKTQHFPSPNESQRVITVSRTKMPNCITFKSPRQSSNTTNQIPSNSRECYPTSYTRSKRMSENINLEVTKPYLPVKHRRLSSHQLQHINQKRKMVVSARDTFKFSSSKGMENNQKNSSLDKLRKELRGFLGGMAEEDLRTSCPGLDRQLESVSLRSSVNPSGEFQFKSFNGKRKNQVEALKIKTEEDQIKESTSVNLQFGAKKSKMRSNNQSITPESKQPHPHYFPFPPNTNAHLHLPINKSNIHSNSPLNPDFITQSTLPSHKSTQNSMLAKTASREGQSSITTKTRQLKQSLIIHEDTEEGNISQRNFEERFTGLRLNKALTRSINIPHPANRMDKKEENDKKPLSQLDMMVIKRNLLKEKRNEEELDVSVEVEEGQMSIKKGRESD